MLMGMTSMASAAMSFAVQVLGDLAALRRLAAFATLATAADARAADADAEVLPVEAATPRLPL